ncbi:substrate-binding domain-containing protein [Kribbella sp. NPDC051586]|uniref:substrate-binding domain-containing protein n=1 Tax=Kribbella sp. NPDC051586 TaxID=3364118 RepID=UPI0037B45D01
MDVLGELALIGFDDHPAAGAVGLSIIRQPVRVAGRRAAEILIDTADNGTCPEHLELPLTLVGRMSTGGSWVVVG